MERNNDATTRGIKHWGLSGYLNILPRIEFGVTGQESSPQSPTISYRHTLAVILKIGTTENKRAKKSPKLANASQN